MTSKWTVVALTDVSAASSPPSVSTVSSICCGVYPTAPRRSMRATTRPSPSRPSGSSAAPDRKVTATLTMGSASLGST